MTELYTNPAWYTDELTHVAIASHLAEGQVRYLAIQDSFLLFARMPVFEYALAGLYRIFPQDINTLRSFTGVLGTLTVAATYVSVRLSTQQRILAIGAAWALAIFPSAILYTRFGFSYALLHLLMPMLLACLTLFARTKARPWLYIGALIVGFGMLSDLMMGTLLPVLWILALHRNWRDVPTVTVVCFLPALLYAVPMLVAAPDAFLFDLKATVLRLNTLTYLEQAVNIGRNLMNLMQGDFWFTLGFIGVFTIRDRELRLASILCLFTPVIILGRTVALFHLSFYYTLPIMPVIALGVASLLLQGIKQTTHIVADILPTEVLKISGVNRLTFALSSVIILSPLFVQFSSTTGHVRGQWQTPVDSFLIDPNIALAAAAFVETHLEPHDTIIASAPIATLIDGHSADFQMSIAALGVQTSHLPANIPAARFAFDPRIENARFVVIDNLWLNWGVPNIAPLGPIVDQVRQWPLVFTAGNISIYKNPNS